MIDRHPDPSEKLDLTEEAAFWCMRVHEEDCTTEEHAAFDRWLKEDPAHAEEYRSMLGIWTVSALLPRAEQQPNHGRPKYQRVSARPLQRFAAAAVIVLAIGLLGWSQGWVPTTYQRFDATDALNQITLADGSDVQLNRNTSLSFLNFRNRRQVRIDKGEAFFHVRHDATHPFEVRAGSGRIVVTGTQFNVWTYEDSVVVTLTEGSVRIVKDRQGSNPSIVYLSPGQQTRYNDESLQPQVAVVDPNTTLAWREGKLILNDLSLGEALPLINRYLDRPLFLADNTVAKIRVGGAFNTDNVQGLVINLPKVLPVQLIQKADGKTIIQSQPNLGSLQSRRPGARD